MKTYEKIYLLLSQAENYVSGEELAQQLDVSRTAVWKAIQQLEKKGVNILSAHHHGYKIIGGDLLVPEWISEQLQIPVHWEPNSISTQQDAKQGIEVGHTAPSLYLAPTQAGAKGRFGRAFFADEHGGIYLSLRLSPQAHFSAIKPYTILVAAAMVKAIESLTQLPVQIKWVNDIYLGEKKVAGILTEAISSIETRTVTDVIIGIGLNFHISHFPETIAGQAGSLFAEQPTITRNQLIVAIWKAFFDTPEEELLALYKEKSLVLGKQVTFVENQITYHGLAMDLMDTGELIVLLPDQSQKILSSGEISLTSW